MSRKLLPAPILARRLRELREAAALTRNALAVRAGISPILVHRLEDGAHGCTWTTACRLADALGVSIAALR